MFVRFRKLKNDGVRPFAAREDLATGEKTAAVFSWEPRQFGKRRNQRRWVIGREAKLQPYRIKVEVVTNSRVNGKVKQDVIARLGTINATWLESFWANASPELRVEHWELYSLRHRAGFWERVLERLSMIGDNRLSKDDRVAIRRAIHKVIPWVMEPERKRLVLLEAQADYRRAKSNYELVELAAEKNRRWIELGKEAAVKLKENEARSATCAQVVTLAGLEIAKLQSQ